MRQPRRKEGNGRSVGDLDCRARGAICGCSGRAGAWKGQGPGGPKPSGREGPPAAGEEGATESPPRAQEFGRGRERADQPRAGEPPSQKGGYNSEEEAGGSREQRERARGPWGRSTEQLLAGDTGERATLKPPARQWERGERDRRGGERRCRRSQGRKTRRVKGHAKPAWEWILLALCLWGTLQMGAALVLKGNHMEGEVFAFDTLRCDNSHALAHYSGHQFCDKGRIKTDNGIPIKAPAGELSVLQLDQEIHFQAPVCKKKRSTMKAVCGAFGHSKLVEPLDIQEPVRLSVTE